MSTSAITVGRVRHRRSAPRAHVLSYGVFHALIDLDDLERLDREVVGFGHNRRAVASFRDADHLGGERRPVRDKLADLLAARGHRLPDGPVMLLTNLRILGHVFNPVSWFLCHDTAGRLRIVVAEVNNTFGESFVYVLDDLSWTAPRRVVARRAKRFHVSPFLPIERLEYRFVLRPPSPTAAPGERIAFHIDVRRDGDAILDATLSARRLAFTTRTLWAALLRYPLVTVKTIVAIHWHAARLALKRVPFHRKPPAPQDAIVHRAMEQAS